MAASGVASCAIFLSAMLALLHRAGSGKQIVQQMAVRSHAVGSRIQHRWHHAILAGVPKLGVHGNSKSPETINIGFAQQVQALDRRLRSEEHTSELQSRE